MSARDDFWAWVNEHDADNAAAGGLLLSAVLSEHAHELAEKIRNSEKLRDFTDDHMSDMNEAADLIDPEVQ